MCDTDLGGRRYSFVVCPEYLRVLSLGMIVPAPTPLYISNFAVFHLDVREQAWRTELARPYVLREAVYAALFTFIRTAQGTCIETYRHPRLHTTEDH